ncbi:p44 [Xanthomonas phage Xop411]|uniref:p44 n=1 Tax=Xanthomonas phage Xop411 TaxID=2913975 RepID=A5H1L4_9CAUD|nr:p44 [Xanthomonas phage Xop411]ABK00191.1 p44 [Xanthomonas phage Xop411]
MTMQDELTKSAELLLELGFQKEASAVSAAVGKINQAWMSEELLAEEAESNVQLRNLVHELRSALMQARNPLPDIGTQQVVSTPFDDGVAAALGVGSIAKALAHGSVAVSTGDRGSSKGYKQGCVAVATGDGATAQSEPAAGGTAIATGKCSAAYAHGPAGVAIATGDNGEVSGSDGAALFLVERSDSGSIVHTWSGIVGREGVLPYTAYHLRDGKLLGEIFD